jgi:hypothetical protein
VATLLQLSADELADLLHTTTKTLRAYREGKKRLGPSASEQVLKLLALSNQGAEVFGSLGAFGAGSTSLLTASTTSHRSPCSKPAAASTSSR